jgi:hypothetical protein
MHFITALVVGYTIGFMLALFVFSWFTRDVGRRNLTHSGS